MDVQSALGPYFFLVPWAVAALFWTRAFPWLSILALCSWVLHYSQGLLRSLKHPYTECLVYTVSLVPCWWEEPVVSLGSTAPMLGEEKNPWEKNGILRWERCFQIGEQFMCVFHVCMRIFVCSYLWMQLCAHNVWENFGCQSSSSIQAAFHVLLMFTAG